jgi:molybdopterin molybdotransferase
MISVEEALQEILKKIPLLGMERLSISLARGRVLGEDVLAPRNIPPWDNSAMDGYALRWEEIQRASEKNPVSLRVAADLPAGRVFRGQLKAGEAIRIMTGAPIPPNLDTVVQSEDTEKVGDHVKILACPEKGKNIRRAGEDVVSGERILTRGTVLGPAHLGMLASFQRAFISVYQSPRVAILSTGDELLEIDEPFEDGKIVNSNSYALAAQVTECGGIPIQLGIAKDRSEDLGEKILQGAGADILITSGGVSVGDYDLVKVMLEKLGQMNFWKVAMRPGQPLAFGMLKGKPLFGLPGNPVSSMVSFEQFVRPSLLKMGGHTNLFRPLLKAVLLETIEKRAGWMHFVRCLLTRKGDELFATTTGEQGSGILSSMVKAQGLIVIPAEKTRVLSGEEVKVLLIDPGFLNLSGPIYLSSSHEK